MRQKKEKYSGEALNLSHWADSRSFEIARCLNERSLQWLARVATTEEAHPLKIFRQNMELWKSLDARACSRAARAPIFLLNCNFQYPDWWASVVNRGVPTIIGKGSNGSPLADGALFMLREILTEARTIAVSEPSIANLLLGAPSTVVKLLTVLTLADIDWISEKYAHELSPRWADKSVFWRNLLLASSEEIGERISELYCHSLQLLGSDILTSRGN